MAVMTYDKELTAIQTWFKSVAGLNSWQLKEMPTKLPRPVVILETPSRGTNRNVGRYEYVVPVNQYGRLCVASVEDAVRFQGLLIGDLEERCGRIQVMEDGQVIRVLRQAKLDFAGQDDTTLESSFTLSYEVTYYRTQPAPAPHATTVVSRVATDYGNGGTQ